MNDRLSITKLIRLDVACRLVNEVLQGRKVRQGLFGRFPVERAQGETVVLALPDGELHREAGKREELVRSVEIRIVFSVAALHFIVVAGRVRTDEFVLDAESGKGFLKESRAVGFGTVQPVGELRTVAGLDALNGIGKFLNNMAKENTG